MDTKHPSIETQEEISTSSRHLALSVNKSHYYPGQAISGILKVDHGTKYENLTLTLQGTSDVAIFGKDRWQVGQAASGAGSGGAGILIPVTSREILTFLKIEVNLEGQSKMDEIPFSLDLPEYQNPQCKCYNKHEPYLLPSSFKLKDPMDPSKASITYKLIVHGHRKGLFKSDDRLVSLCRKRFTCLII